ncbi:MAG: DNA mismatch repair protein MutS, partial [Planctomycetota bacterium]|nr:DNA mismatch repair protein MutS [Planctomycetota bacterium]
MEQKDFFQSEAPAPDDKPPAAAEKVGAEGSSVPESGLGTEESAPQPAAPPRKRKATKKAAKKKGGMTPMMEQFHRAKKDAPGALLFFRMGDFYELFGEDAVTASRELGITLTSRDKGKNDLPMAGVPVKAAEGYLIRLVRKGFKVAICEQLTDPRHTKGIVDRGVVRIVTPGTITEEDALDARESNFLASLYIKKGRGSAPDRAALAWVDLSTGRFSAAEMAPGGIVDELARVRPAELLWPITLEERWEEGIELRGRLGPRVTEREDWRFDHDGMRRALERHFQVKTIEGYGFADDSPVVPAAGALIEYLQETQRTACEHVRHIQKVEPTDHLVLDAATRACLELVVTQRGERREGTLLDAIDRSLTPMGGRLMREWLLSPLTGIDPIRARQAAVAELVAAPFLREELRAVLSDVLDVERLVAKLSTGRANGRDLVALSHSLATVPELKRLLTGPASGSPAGGLEAELLSQLDARLDALGDVTADIFGTLVDEPPLTIKEGDLVRDGIHPELDELRQIAGDGKTWMARFQAAEAERTGIQNLRIGYNSVFGYFLEVPRGQVDRVPEHYIRKQTIKTSERYITPELKEFETKVLKSEELSRDLEYELFTALRGRVACEIGRILDTARAMAELDCLAGLAEVAAENDYCRPTIDDGGLIDIEEGRHPVIEQSAVCEAFVPNDTRLDAGA